MADTFLFANNAETTLAAPLSNVGTSCTLASGTGAEFPSPSASQKFALTFRDAATGTLDEIVYCTARSGDVCTIVRAQEGTVAQAWVTGDIAASFLTAGVMNNATQIPAAQSQATNYAVDSGSTNAYIGVFSPVVAAVSAGAPYRLKIMNSNTGASTFDPGSGALPVLTPAGSALSSGALLAGGVYEFIPDGAGHYILTNPTAVNRIRLTGATSFYVSTTGNDSTNTGLTLGSPWRTLQHAWNIIQQTYDLAGSVATVNLADGAYTAGLLAEGALVGASSGAASLVITASGPGGCSINQSGANIIQADSGARFTIQNVTLSGAGSNGLIAAPGGEIRYSNIAFGAMSAGVHVYAIGAGAYIVANSNYSITGGAASHYLSQRNANLVAPASGTVTLSGTPAFSGAFAGASDCGVIEAAGVTFSGSATGKRYELTTNAVVETGSGGASYFPGNSAGSTATGAQYV